MIKRRKACITIEVLNGGTLKAVGLEHGITSERVGQIVRTVIRMVDPKLCDEPKREWARRRTEIFRLHRDRLCRLIADNTEPDPNNTTV